MLINELFDNFKDIPGNEQQINKSPEEVANYIMKNCSEFLSISKNKKFLYRGFRQQLGLAFIGKPREDRRSTGLGRYAHNRLIQLMDKVGFKATRDKTISCCSSEGVAKFFGYPHYVYPLNGFTYTWSTKYPDVGRLGETGNVSKLRQLTDEQVDNMSAAQAKTLLDEFGFTDTGLIYALQSGYEVAIAGKFIAINYEDEYSQNVIKLINQKL